MYVCVVANRYISIVKKIRKINVVALSVYMYVALHSKNRMIKN